MDVGAVANDERLGVDDALEIGAIDAPVNRIAVDRDEERRRLGKEDLQRGLSAGAAPARGEQKQRESDANRPDSDTAGHWAACSGGKLLNIFVIAASVA